MHAKLPQSCLTLCDPMDCSLPGSSVYGILQARILLQNGLSCPPPGDLPDPRIEPTALMSPALAGGFFTSWALRISTKKKKNCQNFYKTCTKPTDQFEENLYLYYFEPSNPWAWYISSFNWVVFDFFHHKFQHTNPVHVLQSK